MGKKAGKIRGKGGGAKSVPKSAKGLYSPAKSALGASVAGMFCDGWKKGALRYGLARGQKKYELANHLGNVLAVITDRKIQDPTGGYLPCVASYSDYYPFGWEMPGRSSATAGTRYGFKGKEEDPETGWTDFGARMYDPRKSRWDARDPLEAKYPGMTTYGFAANSPLLFVDVDGRDNIIYLVLTKEAQKAYAKTGKFDASLVAQQANEQFDRMGVATRVVVFEGPIQKFKKESIDFNDSYIVFGTNRRDALKGLSSVAGPNDGLIQKIGFSPAFGKSANPEISSVEPTDGSSVGQGGVVTLDALEDFATNSYAKSFDMNEWSAFLVGHIANHNALFTHKKEEEMAQDPEAYGLSAAGWHLQTHFGWMNATLSDELTVKSDLKEGDTDEVRIGAAEVNAKVARRINITFGGSAEKPRSPQVNIDLKTGEKK